MDGFRKDCIQCRKAQDKDRYDAKKDIILAKNLAYREANREAYNARVREIRQLNPDHQKEIEKRRHEKHKEKRNAKCRENWSKNKDKYIANSTERVALKKDLYNEARRIKYKTDPTLKDKMRIYKEINKEKHNNQARVRWSKAPIQKKIRTGIGAAIAHSLKGRTKGGKGWQTILGYTVKDLMKHIESQFKDGMTWDNYGLYGWHIDHIKPESHFKYDSVDNPDFLECWALNNLQPLWAVDNLTKGNRFVG